MWHTYINAASIEGVLKTLAEHGDHARLVAGGTDLILELAKNSLSDDMTGYKSEFVKLVELSDDLDQYAGTIGE